MGVSLAIALLVLIGIVVGVFFLLWKVFEIALVSVLGLYFIMVCLLLMLIILIQKPKGGGLSGAFGGSGGGSQAAFGAKTGDVLTVVTVILFVMFIGFGMGLTWAAKPTIAAATADVSLETTTDVLPDAGTSATQTLETTTQETKPAPAELTSESEASP